MIRTNIHCQTPHYQKKKKKKYTYNIKQKALSRPYPIARSQMLKKEII